MSSLLEKIQQRFIEAKKVGDSAVRILSILKSEIELLQIDNDRVELTDTQVMAVIQKLIKRITDAIALYKQAGRTDLISKEEEDLKVLQKFLPKQFSEEELTKLLSRLKNNKKFTTIKEYIDYMNKNYPGQFDTKILVTLLKKNGYI